MKAHYSHAIALTPGCLAAVLTGLWGFRGQAATWPVVSPITGITQIATAAGPPRLVTEILNGDPIDVLYVTRADDTVLVRCYPGYLPTLRRRAMGRNPDATSAPQEGVLHCQNPADLPSSVDRLPDVNEFQ